VTKTHAAERSPRVRVEVLLDEAERRSALRAATAEGLQDTPKRVPVIWLYDETGSRLFDKITRLPEYYPTRREREILEDRAVTIAERTRAETLVELGSGTSEKTRLLLDALAGAGSLRRFVSLDVSEEVLVASAHEIAREYPDLDVNAVVGDFQRDLSAIPGRERRLVAFLGSTIGNLPFDARARFLRAASASLGPRVALLLGLDLVKDPARIESAYNDAAGLSERFQRNALAHLDRELGSGFRQARFEYAATWDAEHEWVDISFRSVGAQVVPVPELSLDVEFADGERLLMEVSSKFRRERVEAELDAASLELASWWTDEAGDFALALASPSPAATTK
jgi:L-histidine N-alpha-methyltransferase